MAFPRLEEKYDPILFQDMFGNTSPVEMEIGCGKGKFLIRRAKENPKTNFLGIDRVGKWMKRRKIQSEKHSIKNLCFMKAEAQTFLRDAIADASISIFHIYFPDPWPKRRHHGRRVLHADFLRRLHVKLTAGGFIEIATDDEDYFIAMKKSVASTAELWNNIREVQNERIFDPMNLTNYELKWKSQGKPLFYMELRKK